MKTTEHTLLIESIELLKIKQSRELNALYNQFGIVKESLKPINIIKNTFSEAGNSTDFKKGLLNNVIGLATGYLSGKLLLSTTHNPIKKLLGGILQFTIGKFVAKKLGEPTTSNTKENITI